MALSTRVRHPVPDVDEAVSIGYARSPKTPATSKVRPHPSAPTTRSSGFGNQPANASAG
jgi:hypothetical protein